METEHPEFTRTIVRMLDNITANEIAEGIPMEMERKAVKEIGTVVKRITFQPGNGTKYECYVVPLTDDEMLFGWDRGGAGHCALLRMTGLLHYNYFMEKMDIKSFADAHALLVLIKEETGREIVLPNEEIDIPYEGIDEANQNI